MINLLFEHLNLRFNPFGELTRPERAELAVVALGDLPQRLQRPGTAIQFIGGHGHGKSTHLIKLHTRFFHSPYLKVLPQDTLHLDKQGLYFIDSFDCLSSRNRRELYASFTSLACTSHQDLTREMRRNKFRVTTIKVGNPPLPYLKTIFTRRIEFARRSPGGIPTLSERTIKWLFKEFGEDIRAMENYLYDRFQALQGVENV